MKSIVLLALALFTVPVLAQEQKTDQVPAQSPKYEIRMFEVKHRRADQLAKTVMALGSGRPGTRIDDNAALKTITVRDMPENIAAIGVALARLDVPEPAPASIQFQLYLLAASDEEMEKSTFPKELEPVLASLRVTLRNKNYRFLNTYIGRANDGGSFESSGPSDLKVGAQGGNPTFLTYRLSGIHLNSDGNGKEMVRVDRFSFGLRLPIQTAPGQIQYHDVGLNLDLTVPEGGMTVIGTVNLGPAGGAMIVVVSAKKVN